MAVAVSRFRGDAQLAACSVEVRIDDIDFVAQ